VIPQFQKEFNELSKMMALPDQVTTGQMQRISAGIDVAKNPLNPTINDRTAAIFARAVDASYDDVANVQGHEVAKEYLTFARSEYAKRISQFDDKLLQNLTRDPSKITTLEPDKVIDLIMKPNSPALAARAMKFADDSTKLKLKRAAVDKILESYKKEGREPFELLYDGVGLKRMINKFGEKTLNQVIGKDSVQSLQKLADVTKLAGIGTQSGGIVAANVALHPMANLGVIAKLNVMNHFLRTPTAMKWLTIGVDAPKTRAGAAALTRLTAHVTALAESERAKMINRPQARRLRGEQ
ncbi:MAG: hypothetical protein GQ474_07830, partial [Sulfurimonas sp.]|nr:hypothetical protein [Sulfurimonas sp.]